MSASAAIKAALRAAFAEAPALAGVAVHDAPPPDARPPYLVLGPDLISDWGWKGGEGRRHKLAVTLWSRDGGAGQGEALMDAAERAALALPADLDGVRLLAVRPERRWARRGPTGLAEAGVELRMISVEVG